MRSGLCLHNIPSSLSFNPWKQSAWARSGLRTEDGSLSAQGMWKDAEKFGSVQNTRQPSGLRQTPCTRWTQNQEFPPLYLMSISHQSAAGTAQGTLPSHGLLLTQELPHIPGPAVLPPLLKGLSLFLALLLFFLKCFIFLHLCLFLLSNVFSTGIMLGKGAGKILKTHIASKTVISVGIAST